MVSSSQSTVGASPLESRNTNIASSPFQSVGKPEVDDIENMTPQKVALSEDEALVRARAAPDKSLPIYLIFAPDDRDNPRNWPKWKRRYISCFASFLNFVTCICADGLSSGALEIQSKFQVSAEITTLSLSLYVLGFAVGPVLLASLSEYYGHTLHLPASCCACAQHWYHLSLQWTSYPTIHWIVPILASTLFGAGIYIIILSILNYVVDSYQTYSASALAGVILVRNVVGAGFPLFATQMYEKLGYEWASSLLGFISILLVPIPFLFFYYGEWIRLRSPWAREHFDQEDDAPH